MFKRCSLVILLLAFLCASGWAFTPNQVVRPKRVVHIHELIQKLGTGEDAAIAVRMNDKTAIAGYVQEFDQDSFTVIDRETGMPVKVSAYKIDRLQGFNVANGTEVHEGTGIRAKFARAALKVLPGHQVPQNALSGHDKTLILGIIIGVILAIVLAKVL